MKYKVILIIILFIAFISRVICLDKYPLGFTPDEASFGYDALSLIETGSDQWGEKFPLVLKSFGDYKPPLYAYLLTPFVYLFGLSKQVIRMPNALLGTAAVFVVYLLAGELGRLAKFYERRKKELQLIAAFLLAISPWHIMMSRGGFEANITTFLMPLGIYLFLKGLKNYKLLIISTIIFGLNLFSYHSAKIVVPMVLASLIVIYYKEIVLVKRKYKLISLATFLFFMLMSFYTFTFGAGTRMADISVYKGSLEEAAIDRIDAINGGLNPYIARLSYNKYTKFSDKLISNYVQYLSPQYLFTSGPKETTYGMIPGRGVLYLIEIILIGGVIMSFFGANKEKLKVLVFLVFWILIAPLPAAMALGPGYAGNRSVIMLPAIQLLLAFGAVELMDIARIKLNPLLYRVVLGFVLVVFMFSYIFFVRDYFYSSQNRMARGMLYGNLEISEWLIEKSNEYEEVIVSRGLSEPHIYLAFAGEWDIRDFQMATTTWNFEDLGLSWVDQMPLYKLGKFTFDGIHWDKHKMGEALLVGQPSDFPEDVITLMVIDFPDYEHSILVVDPKMNVSDL